VHVWEHEIYNEKKFMKRCGATIPVRRQQNCHKSLLSLRRV